MSDHPSAQNPPAHSPDIDRTAAALAEEFRESPYRVDRTAADTVQVTIDLVDTAWWEMLQRSGETTVYTYEIRFWPGNNRCAITDTLNQLTWTAGAGQSRTPHLTRTRSIQQGRVIEMRYSKVATPAQGTVLDVSFNSEQPRKRIRRILSAHGWKEGLSIKQKVGIVAACLGGVAAIAGVVVAIMLG